MKTHVVRDLVLDFWKQSHKWCNFTNYMTYTVIWIKSLSNSSIQRFYFYDALVNANNERSQVDCEAGLITKVNPIFRCQLSMTFFNLFLSRLSASLFTCLQRIFFQYMTYFINWLKRRVAHEILILLLLIKDFMWIKSSYFLVFFFLLVKIHSFYFLFYNL